MQQAKGYKSNKNQRAFTKREKALMHTPGFTKMNNSENLAQYLMNLGLQIKKIIHFR